MNSSTIRWLIDAENGGPPRAYECLIFVARKEKHCGAVTRTIRGMRSHQRSVHAFDPQPKLFREPAGEKPSDTRAEVSGCVLKSPQAPQQRDL